MTPIERDDSPWIGLHRKVMGLVLLSYYLGMASGLVLAGSAVYLASRGSP